MMPFLAWFLPLVFTLAAFALGRFSARLAPAPRIDVRGAVEYALDVMGRLPSTNLKLVAAIVAAHTVIMGAMLLSAIGKPIGDGELAILAGLAIGVDAIALKQFGKKRETDAAHVAAQAQARAGGAS